MIRLPTMRARQSPAGRLAVFVVAWLNLVIAPCALAEAGQHDCVHCPPDEGQVMSSHHGHAEASAATQSPCATMQADCCELAAATVDSRGADNSKTRKAEAPGCDLAPAFAELKAIPRAAFCVASDPPDPPVYAAPPRHVLNCVYLD